MTISWQKTLQNQSITSTWWCIVCSSLTHNTARKSNQTQDMVGKWATYYLAGKRKGPPPKTKCDKGGKPQTSSALRRFTYLNICAAAAPQTLLNALMYTDSLGSTGKARRTPNREDMFPHTSLLRFTDGSVPISLIHLDCRAGVKIVPRERQCQRGTLCSRR